MIKTSFEAILEFAKVHGRVRPAELVQVTGNSRSMVHRALKKLVTEGKLEKVGSGPRIFYLPTEIKESYVDLKSGAKMVLEENYIYVTPQGEILKGMEGFVRWVRQIKQEKYLDPLSEEYLNTRLEANKHISIDGWVDGTDKIKNTFPNIFIDGVYFRDFYSLPKFGKTKLGQLVMLAKTSGNKELVAKIANECKPAIEKLVALLGVEAVGFVPHSVPRLVQFNTELNNMLNIKLSEIKLRKAYLGLPVQQKSLSRLEERVENAKKTIYLEDVTRKFDSVLLIDDAVGSGSTMNEVAHKLKDSGVAKKVYGFAIVGSMKGFEVISVV